MAFFGSGSFGVPVLERLSRLAGLDLVAVVSVPDRPAGRSGMLTPVPVVTRSRELGLSVLQITRLRAPETRELLAELEPEVAILADYGRIIPPELLAVPRRGFLNLHPSLLPRHRGASPIQAAIVAGDDETGVTLFRMDEGMDTGPILASERIALEGSETAPELETRLAAIAVDVLARTLPAYLAGTIPEVPQRDEGATVTRPLRRRDGRLDPARPAVLLERQVRALQPWPGSFVETVAGRLVVWRSEAVAAEPGVPSRPGLLAPEGLATVDGILVLHEVQPAGGRRMPWGACLRGRPTLAGSMVLPGPD